MGTRLAKLIERSASRVRRSSGGHGPDRHYADYDLEERLGSGASGTVWRARRKGRAALTVAIKEPKAGASRDDMERLRREGEVLAGLDHPHTMKVLEIIDAADGVAIVMQHAAGGSLEDLLATCGPLAADQAVAILAPIADALASAHRRSVFHGDVKPANILFTSDGEPLLSDFGVATAPGLPRSSVEHVRATPEYVDPEVVKGAPVGARSDVYSLGVVGYEILAGTPPYEGDDALAVLRAADGGQHPPLQEIRPDVPPSLAELLERSVQRQPGLRPAAAEELSRGLRASVGHRVSSVLLGSPRAHADGSPEEATRRGTHDFGPRPPSVKPPVRPGLRRSAHWRPSPAWLFSLAGALLVLGIGTATWRASNSSDGASRPPVDPTATSASPIPTLTTTPPSISATTTVTTAASTSSIPTKIFTATDGRFSVEFPGPPTRVEGPIQLYGRAFIAVSYLSTDASGTVGVSYVDDAIEPGSNPGSKLAGAMGATSARVGAVIERQSASTFLGNPARDVVYKADQFRLFERVMIVGGRLIMLDNVTTGSSPSASYQRLLATFKLN
ncbi:MAG: serine/threonine-protein kinase [Acidimicrobiales bacterium]